MRVVGDIVIKYGGVHAVVGGPSLPQHTAVAGTRQHEEKQELRREIKHGSFHDLSIIAWTILRSIGSASSTHVVPWFSAWPANATSSI